MNLSLPPNPPGCISLTDPESARLRSLYPNVWANPHNSCPNCQKTGTFRARSGDAIVTYDCPCVEQWKLHRWLLNAGIGMRYQRLSWLDATEASPMAQMAVMQYVEHAARNVASGQGLTLGSPNKGTGKTLLATLLLKAMMADGHDGYFIQFNEMLDAFSAGWRDKEDRAWFIRRVRNAGVLVVDDIGREHKGRAEVSEAMFDTVVRARVAAAQPTIITTNYTPDELLQGYGSNVLSLLTEVNVYVDCPGRDFRPEVHRRTAQDSADGVVSPIVVR